MERKINISFPHHSPQSLKKTLLKDQRESDYLFFGKINVFALSLHTLRFCLDSKMSTQPKVIKKYSKGHKRRF